MTVFEAYITNLGKYAEGQLVGETLKFPATTEEVQSLLKNIGVDGVRYEEFFITAFDGNVMGLYDYLTEYENLDELNHLAHLISELDSDEIETLEAALNKLLWDKMSQSRVWGGSPTSVFAARRDAKIASVATLALLAVSAFPGTPTKKRRQRCFLRSLRFAVFYDCVDNPLDEPQFAFVERIKLNIDPLLCGFIGAHIWIKVFVHGDTEHCYHLVKGV